MLKFIEARDAAGARFTIPTTRIRSIRHGAKSETFHVVTLDDDSEFRIEKHVLDDLRASDFNIVPAAPGWHLATWERDHRERSAEKYGSGGEAIAPHVAPLIAWRIFASGTVEPVTPGDEARHAYADSQADGEKFPSDIVVVSPEGRGFVLGRNAEGVNFSEEVTLGEWANGWFEDRHEDEERRGRDAERASKRRAAR